MQIESMHISDFLNQSFPCACGKIHATALQTVEISQGAIEKIPDIMRRFGYHSAFIITDETTYAVVGHQVVKTLCAASVSHKLLCIPQPEVVPDEAVMGRVLMAFDRSCDLVIGVGSGTINDISRFLSYQTGLSYFIVGTAPSMDGYASTVAPLITNNLKTTYETHVPQAIIADVDVLAKAPMHMIAAGFGDILGKFTCLCDWRLSAIINGEYHCQTLEDMMMLAVRRTIDTREGLRNRNPEAITRLMEALVLAGIAMSFAGNSRPASGCEHHLSHYWEMQFLLTGKKAVLHGTKVGIGTIAALRLYEALRSEKINFASVCALPVPAMNESWEAQIRKAFGVAADEVILLERKVGKNAPEARLHRLEKMAAHWPEIQEVLAHLPSSDEIAALLQSVGGATTPQEVGLDAETVHDSICFAKEVRNRYTLLQTLWDLRLLDDYASRITSLWFH